MTTTDRVRFGSGGGWTAMTLALVVVDHDGGFGRGDRGRIAARRPRLGTTTRTTTTTTGTTARLTTRRFIDRNGTTSGTGTGGGNALGWWLWQ